MGTPPKLPEADFIKTFEEVGAAELQRRTGGSLAGIYRRRAFLERKHGRQITGPEHPNRTRSGIVHPHRVNLEIKNGTVVIGSDGHYWPGEPSTAHRAFVKFTKELKPSAVIFNGDAFDGASISRHPPIGWANQPTVQEEIEACQDRLHEIVEAAPRKADKVWCLGNHDSRFETKIAVAAPELAKVQGTSLQDHFPLWTPCWSVWINGDVGGVVVKHRFKSGIHAPFNNAMWAGRSIVTGHLHSAKVYPFTDYNGTRYGVDTGCLADAYGEQFRDYTEDNARNHRSGFAVLTFKDGQLLMPELVLVFDETRVQFRGELVKV